jgi:hypothetical protein
MYPIQVCLYLSTVLVPFLLLSYLPYCIIRLSLYNMRFAATFEGTILSGPTGALTNLPA